MAFWGATALAPFNYWKKFDRAAGASRLEMEMCAIIRTIFLQFLILRLLSVIRSSAVCFLLPTGFRGGRHLFAEGFRRANQAAGDLERMPDVQLALSIKKRAGAKVHP